jgi:hypothetical protein
MAERLEAIDSDALAAVGPPLPSLDNPNVGALRVLRGEFPFRFLCASVPLW